RVVRPAVIRCPIKIPAAFVVRHRVISAGLFPNPEDGRHNAHFPRVTLNRRVRTGRNKYLRFHLEQGLLPELHGIFGEVRSRGVRGSGLFIPEDFRGASNRKTETGRKKSPHYERRHPLSDSPATGKANFPGRSRESEILHAKMARFGCAIMWI